MASVLEPELSPGEGVAGSDRNFGFVFAAVFAIVGTWPILAGEWPRWWAFVLAAAFALAAIVRPGILGSLNRAWLAIGRLLHRIVSPIVMGVIFFLCVTPIAWIMRLRGKDVLSLGRRPDLSSYWIIREPLSPSARGMKNQF